MSGAARSVLGGVARVVVKVGTAVVTRPDGAVALGRLGALVEDLHALREAGKDVVLVSSGAVGLGVARLGLPATPKALVDRQACAAAGQGALLAIYDHLFRQLGHPVAQVLLTREDFLDRRRYVNLHATLERLLALGAVPIINENDTVSTAELGAGEGAVFGDNDRLSALVTAGIGADLLVLLTNVDGVHTAPPGTPGATRIARWDDDEVVFGAGSAVGRGGMEAKLRAAVIARHGGAHVVIASGDRPGVVSDVLAGSDVGTWFSANEGLSRRRQWLAYATAPEGAIWVNDGARLAVCERSASLLPAGILAVHGGFAAGAVVRLCDDAGREFGRGLAAADDRDLRERRGRSGGQRPAVHRDNVVILAVEGSR